MYAGAGWCTHHLVCLSLKNSLTIEGLSRDCFSINPSLLDSTVSYLFYISPDILFQLTLPRCILLGRMIVNPERNTLPLLNYENVTVVFPGWYVLTMQQTLVPFSLVSTLYLNWDWQTSIDPFLVITKCNRTSFNCNKINFQVFSL